MNLKSRKARLPIAALGACALVTTGGVLTAGSAFAAESLTLLPSATSATITDLNGVGATTATQNAADASYAIKFGGLSGADLKASVTGTAGGVVKVQKGLANAAPDDGGTWTSASVGAGSAAVVGTTAAATNIYYLQSLTPGTYTVRFFEDTNGNGAYDSSVDAGAPAFTLNVKDVTAATADTADDLSLSVTAPSQILKGEVVAAKASTGLTTTDARGTATVNSKTVGALGKEISDVLTIGFAGGGLAQAGAATTFDDTTYNRTSNTTSAATDVTTTATIGSVSKAATTTVSDNAVTALAYNNTDTANVDYPSNGGNAVVRTGTSAVTYKVKATGASNVPISGARVFFRVLPDTGGTTAIVAADLSTSAGTPDSDGDVSVLTGSDGIATLTVTSAKTASANSYTVAARTNNVGAVTIDAAYATAVTDEVRSGGPVAAKVGTSVTLTGTVYDQFDQPFNPGAGVTAALNYTNNGAVPTPTTGSFAIGSDGKFSATVTEPSTNTVVNTDSYDWTVQTVTSATHNIYWRASITAGAVAIDDITNSAGGTSTLPFAATTTTVDLTAGGSNPTYELFTGILRDDASSPAALPGTSVKYTGSEGVYFYNDTTDKVVKELTAQTNANGELSYDGTTDGVYVLYTKSGAATITATAGSVSKTVSTPVEAATEAWKVTVNDLKGKPGTATTLTGTVKDAFGNPTVNALVTLELDTVSAGSFSGTDADNAAGFQVKTDSTGVWSTPFTSTSNQNGTATVKATLTGQTVNAVADTDYAAIGLTVGSGEYTDQAKITVAEPELTLQSSSQLTYGSKYYARGALLSGDGANPGATVEIYSKLPGGSYDLIDTVKADENGEFGAVEKISKSTYFLVKSGGASSTASATRVYSGVTLVATSSKADRVTLSANGGPNAKAYLYFYRVFASGDTDYLGKKLSSSYGNGSATFKAPSGNRKYKVLFKAPGTTTGSDTDSVKVK